MKIVEPYLTNTGTIKEGELTKQHNAVTGLGSLNGTGLMQSIIALKIRELYKSDEVSRILKIRDTEFKESKEKS